MVPVIRSMRRFKQALPLDACKEVLKNGRRGVLSIIGDDGYPYGVPINYVYDEKENALYFHGAKEGHKIDAIKKSGKVCFTVFDEDYKEDGDWAYYVKSVIVFGRAKVVEDEKETLRMTRLIGLKYYPTVKEVDAILERTRGRVQGVRVDVEKMTGKLVHEK